MKRKHSSKKITLVALAVICCVLVLTEQNIIPEASIEKAELPVKIGQEPVRKRPSAFDKKSGSFSEKKATVNGRQTQNVGIEIPLGPKKNAGAYIKTDCLYFIVQPSYKPAQLGGMVPYRQRD